MHFCRAVSVGMSRCGSLLKHPAADPSRSEQVLQRLSLSLFQRLQNTLHKGLVSQGLIRILSKKQYTQLWLVGLVIGCLRAAGSLPEQQLLLPKHVEHMPAMRKKDSLREAALSLAFQHRSLDSSG